MYALKRRVLAVVIACATAAALVPTVATSAQAVTAADGAPASGSHGAAYAEADRREAGTTSRQAPPALERRARTLYRLMAQRKHRQARKIASPKVVREMGGRASKLSRFSFESCHRSRRQGHDFEYYGPMPWGCSGTAIWNRDHYALIGVGFRKERGRWVARDFQIVYID